MSELAQALQWLESTMQADSALMAAAVGNIWLAFAPIGTVAPFVVMSQQSSSDVMTANATRLFTDMLMQIKVIGPATNFAAIVIGADRIDALFKSVKEFGLSSGGVLCCYREQIVSYSEIINGAAWHHLGGLYHISLQGV